MVGFDNIALGSFVTTALTTVALPLHPMGVAAGEMFLRLLAGVEKPRRIWFPPKLTVRESSAESPTPAARTHAEARGVAVVRRRRR